MTENSPAKILHVDEVVRPADGFRYPDNPVAYLAGPDGRASRDALNRACLSTLPLLVVPATPVPAATPPGTSAADASANAERAALATRVVLGLVAATGHEIARPPVEMPASGWREIYAAYRTTLRYGAAVASLDALRPVDDGPLLTPANGVTVEAVDAVVEWVHDFLAPRKTANDRHPASELAAILEHDTGVRLTPGQLTNAVAAAGIPVFHRKRGATLYGISEKSAALWPHD